MTRPPSARDPTPDDRGRERALAARASGAGHVDVGALERGLKARVKGEVRFDEGSRGLYATDASNYRQVPIGIVIPKDEDDVIATVQVCHALGAPILGRGGGTSLAGQCCNVGVVIDFSKYMNKVLEVDAEKRIARVQPGCVLDDLRDAAEEHGLTFGPDPATHDRCTLGGMIGNNSCGVHSQMAGRTADNVIALDVLTYDGLRVRVGETSETELGTIIANGGRRGEIYRALKEIRDEHGEKVRADFPDIPRRVSGYNLDELLPENGFHVARALVGSESTCVIVLEATLKLVESPGERALLVVGFEDVAAAGDAAPVLARFGPIGLEAMDGKLVRYAKQKNLHARELELLPDGDAWALVEFGAGSREEALRQAERTADACTKEPGVVAARVFRDPEEARKVWAVRESGLGATARVLDAADTWPGWEDAAVPPERLGDYLRDFLRLLDEYGYEASLYGHFGQGCVHTRIPFDLRTADGVAKYRAFVERAADVVVAHGGSLSGEHGDGQARGELLPRMFSPDVMDAFRRFKRAWDPDGKMNPGKLVDADPLDANLRLGTGYRPWEPFTEFSYPDDDHKFSRTTLRCVGVGKCRRHDGGTMCPSFMVTREEKHSTRGRARLLFEMLNGDVVEDRWKSDAVKEALDLCLACKGCKTECPANVDMATYKAEFNAHYYEERLRPRSAYAFGLIHWWARLASKMPRAVNFATQAPGLRRLAKWAAGAHSARGLPRFATRTFRDVHGDRERPNAGGPRVILWPDTFNNHFHPRVLESARLVLEEAGCDVVIPPRILCCGRPLYDYGFLDKARGLYREILDTLEDDIRAGTPVVGLEPSCVSSFRDELPNLLHDDMHALRLSKQVFTLAEFLTRKAPAGWRPPELARRALLHGHCHHKTVLGFEADEELARRMGLDVEVPDSGCCGMAGAFGFEKDKYEVSVAAGERVLLPAVRREREGTLIVTDGFSCREQVAQGTGRDVMHFADVLRLGLEAEGRLPRQDDDDPE